MLARGPGFTIDAGDAGVDVAFGIAREIAIDVGVGTLVDVGMTIAGVL
ncbi:MAG: hypothetical protein M1358_12060 [Chloroflexi bacterium]|nr:hypothetical protein [Chloroflexota bacterium]